MDFCKNYPLPDWTSGFEHRKTSISQLPYEEYTGPMEKSASDTNSYRLIRLPNNLVVMCVQDAETGTAAATLSVSVGSNMDPVELQGLAHLLEHMLFRDCIDRELCAVDSEFKGLLNNDGWRLHQIERKLSDPYHPNSKFMIGSIDSLKQGAKDHGIDLHEELLKFYNKYYSSDIMRLAIYGNHSLDRLVELAASKFSDIKSKGDHVQRNLGHPVSAEFLGKAVYYETLNDKHVLRMTFPVPNVKAMYRSDPFNYISHFIGHKGQGSITSYLKQKGWATFLSVTTNTGYNDGFCELYITIDATPEGLEHYEDIMRTVFAYVRMLVSSGPQEWAQKEMSSLMKVAFDSKQKPKPINQVLSYMDLIFNEYLAPEHVLSKDKMYEKFDYDAILHYLSFINSTNFRVFLGARKHKSVEYSEVEPYFGVAYHVDCLLAELLLELASDGICVDGLSLPEKNEFMSTDSTIKNTNTQDYATMLQPLLLKLNDNLELWFKNNSHSGTTNGKISLSIDVPTVKDTPQSYVMNKAKTFKVDSAQFSVYLALYTKGLGNVDNLAPAKLCEVYRDYITKSSQWHYKLVASEMAKITLDKIQAHVDSLFDVTFIKMCMVGNFDEEGVLKVADNVQDIIKPSPNFGYALTLQVEGESNPMYMTMHINRFIHEMQQQLIDITDEELDDRKKSSINIYQKQVKNISEEDGIYEGRVRSTSAGLEVCNKQISILQSVEKEELLEFWNKYTNPSTAPAYTRIDVQMWSTKIWKPTVCDFKEYSAKTLALYGCLHSEGNDALDVGKVDEFITTAITARKEQANASDDSGSLIAKLKSASLSASGAMYTAGKSAERATHTGTALVLAINDHETFGNYADVSHTNFATIGMNKSPDGIWLMTDCGKFQATQQLYGLKISEVAIDQLPKYN
ncbi:metalloprotease [Coemansia pectinata]|uniref:Metalloprotease n=1 Tax=Coemansia pectinata TaxID=1052879 RepID=A0A9W8GU32_9FUNG|nr:metalloprotease [Coemansia pectinata]